MVFWRVEKFPSAQPQCHDMGGHGHSSQPISEVQNGAVNDASDIVTPPPIVTVVLRHSATRLSTSSQSPRPFDPLTNRTNVQLFIGRRREPLTEFVLSSREVAGEPPSLLCLCGLLSHPSSTSRLFETREGHTHEMQCTDFKLNSSAFRPKFKWMHGYSQFNLLPNSLWWTKDQNSLLMRTLLLPSIIPHFGWFISRLSLSLRVWLQKCNSIYKEKPEKWEEVFISDCIEKYNQIFVELPILTILMRTYFNWPFQWERICIKSANAWVQDRRGRRPIITDAPRPISIIITPPQQKKRKKWSARFTWLPRPRWNSTSRATSSPTSRSTSRAAGTEMEAARSLWAAKKVRENRVGKLRLEPQNYVPNPVLSEEGIGIFDVISYTDTLSIFYKRHTRRLRDGIHANLSCKCLNLSTVVDCTVCRNENWKKQFITERREMCRSFHCPGKELRDHRAFAPLRSR